METKCFFAWIMYHVLLSTLMFHLLIKGQHSSCITAATMYCTSFAVIYVYLHSLRIWSSASKANTLTNSTTILVHIYGLIEGATGRIPWCPSSFDSEIVLIVPASPGDWSSCNYMLTNQISICILPSDLNGDNRSVFSNYITIKTPTDASVLKLKISTNSYANRLTIAVMRQQLLFHARKSL